MAEPWLSADDIAAHLGITKDTVYDWIAEKQMPAHRAGRLWKFQVSEVDAWLRAGSAADGGHRTRGHHARSSQAGHHERRPGGTE